MIENSFLEDKYISPLVSCIKCGYETSAKGIFTHFLSKHDPNPFKKETGKGTKKFLLMCCDITTKKEMSTATLAKIIKNEKNKHATYKECPKCGTLHEKNGTYCSSSCANSRHLSQTVKDRISTTLKQKPKKPIVEIEIKCSVCGKPFSTPKNKQRKTCSTECTSFLQNLGARKGGQNSARKTVKRSKDEIALAELCSSFFKYVTTNDNSIANGWDADILLHDHKIAVLWNGPWHYKEMGFGNHSLLQVQNRDKIKIKEFQKAGWSVEVFEDRHFTPETAFEMLKQKYGNL